jgi:hypothetical protein
LFKVDGSRRDIVQQGPWSICFADKVPLKADSNKNKVKNHFDFCCNKIMKLDMNNVISTTKPPANAQEPGYSPITSQIRIGARILSPKIRRATSALGIYLGPNTIKHVDAAIRRL